MTSLSSLRRWRWWLLAGLIIILAATWLSRRGKPVDTVTVRAGPIAHTLVFSARVASVTRSDVASTITGRVTDVLVREGDRVTLGQPLLRLEQSELAAQLAQAEAALFAAQARLRAQREVNAPVSGQALLSAQAQHDFARREADRSRELAAKGFIGQARVQDAERTELAAKAALAQAQMQAQANAVQGAETQAVDARLREALSQRDLAQARLAQTTIVAPGVGRVIARSVEPGIVVQPGRTLLTLALDGETRLIAQIDEKNVAMLREGQAATAAADAFPNERFAAVLTYLSPAVDAARGTLEARLRVDKPPAFLRDDMTVSTEIVTANVTKAIVVPVAAIRERNGSATVLQVDSGRATTVPVTLGIRSASDVQITAGIAEGATLIVDPAVTEGARVRAVERPTRAPKSDFEPPSVGR